MHRFRRHRDVIALVAALVLPLGMAVILVPFGPALLTRPRLSSSWP